MRTKKSESSRAQFLKQMQSLPPSRWEEIEGTLQFDLLSPHCSAAAADRPQRVFTTSRRGRNPLVLVKSGANWMCFHHFNTRLSLGFFFSVYPFSHLEPLCIQTHLKKQTLLLRRQSFLRLKTFSQTKQRLNSLFSLGESNASPTTLTKSFQGKDNL